MDQKSIKEAAAFLNKNLTEKPEIGLILGSGLGVLADEIDNPVSFLYKQIPHFPESTVSGHKGQLVAGILEGRQVIAMQGRFHYYEGYTMQQVTFPVRVMKELGIDSLVVTNAAGGINKSFHAGDLMLIDDHINNMGNNPLIGPNQEEMGDRFPDMSAAYDSVYLAHADQCAEKIGLTVRHGVYVANTGPAYETPAEIRMLRTFGGDAVGMSTVPEVIAAAHSGLRVLGISCISNMAAGILDQPLTHNEVIETTDKVKENFLRFVKEIIRTLPIKERG
ncbi:purine-nucleoside phosphorylase [Virgibacillus siamensis]|uniref:purine-nucleoside phosphorylase n=1 Tax=Virgibacillus siamensis TaxID=480071 RepID=UPI0009850268|nr:purine-nucleoside phosphorylase [Virgibacillus siamensis]